MKNKILLIALTCFALSSVGQDSSYKISKYFIDTQIGQRIQKMGFNDTGTLRNAMTFKVTWDEDTIFNQRNPIDCYTNSILSNDTIYIVGYMIGQLGFGFQLVLFGDSCIVASFALSDGTIYKYTRSDTTRLSFISVPSVTQKLLLSKRPTFKGDERVAGFVEIESKEFYYALEESEKEKRSVIKLRAYFKTAIIKKSY